MFKQLAYEFRVRRSLRLITLAAVVAFDLALYFLFARGNMLGAAGHVLAIVFSSLSLATLLAIGLFCDFDAVHRLFAPPAAYHVQLAPVSPFSLLGSRVLINLVQDLVFVIVGVCGLLLQLTAIFPPEDGFTFATIAQVLFAPEQLTYLIQSALVYIQLVLVIYFGVTLSSTLLGSMRGRKPLAVLIAIALMYVLPQLNLVLFPLNNGTVFQYGVFMTFEILPLPSLAAFLMLALELVKCVALYLVSGKLMERKLNIT